MFRFLRRQKRPDASPPLPHEEFVCAVYRGCLQREPDEEGYRAHLERLRAGTLSWDEMIRGVLASGEYKVRAREIEVRDAAMAHFHECRKAVFTRHVPAADVVVDLGGASNDDVEGALFALGYPHAPRELTIVDLPPGERFEGGWIEPPKRLRAARGTAIRYVYGSMADLGFQADATVDLVVSGESLEHVCESDARTVCREAYRVLRPGGHFWLDTPNARLTRIQSPGQLIHGEHKKEYRVEELRALLEGCGFRIQRMCGICAMERSAAEGIFDYGEMAAAPEISDDPEVGYAIYVDAVKP